MIVKAFKSTEVLSDEQNPALIYPGKPIICGSVDELLENNQLRYSPSGRATLRYPPYGVRVIPASRQYNLVTPTMAGLLEDLVPGSPLADQFYETAWKSYERAVTRRPDRPAYGVAVYYPDRDDLVIFAPPEWHQLALLTRNSLLIRDQSQTITWEDQRRLFHSTIVGVAGASVGKNVFLRLVDTLRPSWIKIADPSRYKLTNANRTSLSYWEMGQSKAVVAAKQVHRIDPFIKISVYSEGLHGGTLTDFIGGNRACHEPPCDIVVEETDNLDTKIDIWMATRDHQKPTFMVTDIGVAHQIDYRDFRHDPRATLAVGIDDADLLTALDIWRNDRADRAAFFRFVFKLIGDEWETIPEFRALITNKLHSPFASGLPQLGVAAEAGGCSVAVMIAQQILGDDVPARTFVNPRDWMKPYSEKGTAHHTTMASSWQDTAGPRASGRTKEHKMTKEAL